MGLTIEHEHFDPADYLADDTFTLIRCEFCGDDIDATDLVPRDDAQAA